MVNYFYLKDGRIIKTIEELPNVLETLKDSVFSEHVTPYKNDFARWIYNEFHNSELASLIGAIKSKEETIRTILAYLKIQELKKNEKLNLSKNEPQKEVQFSNQVELNSKQEDKKNFETTNEINKENKTTETKNEQISKETEKNLYNENPDDFFKKNPIIIEQVIEAKKENLVLEPLLFIDFDKNNPQKSIELFKDNYAKAYQRMSFLRKSGFDTTLVEMMLFRILPKIKLYESSNEEKDGLTIKRYLNEAIEELNNLK